MDYYEEIWYHGNIKEENPFLMLLAAPTKEKMEEISKGDDFMRELNDKVERLNDDSDIIDIIIENEEEIIANSLFDSGVKEGINQRSVDIARKMLEKNMNIKDICEITNLSKKEIEDLF